MRAFRLGLLILFMAFTPLVPAQNSGGAGTSPQPAPDVLIFTNGDQLTGKLERASGGSVVFKSDMAGELTIAFDKIKELRSGAQFALLRKGEKVQRNNVEVGAITVTAGKVAVAPPAATSPVTVPAVDVNYLVDKDTFDRSLAHRAAFTEGWNGSITAGASLVRSTQNATNFTAAVALVRAIPTVSFLPARNRTTVDLTESYGRQTSPVIPQTTPASPSLVVLSNIFHAGAERDQYFSPRMYVLVDTAFDHDYAQGLQLQQLYGGGVGWTAFKTDKHELDLKAEAHYEKQAFQTSSANLEIFGSTFAESYIRHLPRKLVFTENGNYLPAWNQTQAYSANLTATLAIPVFKRLSASLSTTDNYLNDPSPGYKKNSYQFTTGVTYSLK
jgi:hypothetical protein